MDELSKNFKIVVQWIKHSRYNAYKSINMELINLYWEIGKYISDRIHQEGWGKKTVNELAEYIQHNEPGSKGFSNKNLWRMKQFYETYVHLPKLSAVLREISWTNNVIIFSRCKSIEEKTFYLHLVKKEKYSSRELERQINASYYERTLLSVPQNQNFGNQINRLPRGIGGYFKETYVFEFLNLTEPFSENQLKKALIQKIKSFILELGKDFLYMGEEYRLQVGNKDFYLDLLFFHRQLQCLVAFELKTNDFLPEHLGQLNFYLEALDRDIKKTHENPSIGVLLCRDKDTEVVEYALNRNLSPAMVTRYQMILPDKKMIQAKLHEFIELWHSQNV